MSTDDTPQEPSYIKNDTKMERLFADTIAAVLVLSLPVFIAAMLISYMGASAASVGAVWLALYAIVVLMGAVRLFGKGALSAALSAAKEAVSGITK